MSDVQSKLLHDHDHEKVGSRLLLNTEQNQQEACHTAPPSETSVDWPHKMTTLLAKSSQLLCCKCNMCEAWLVININFYFFLQT